MKTLTLIVFFTLVMTGIALAESLDVEVTPFFEPLKYGPFNLTGILKTSVTLTEAKKICHDKGMRLPTARELALASQSMGAKGISETKKDGYYLVKGSDSSGKPDPFYFNNKGYRRPAGELGNYWFWSSSGHPDYSGNAYILVGTYGYIDGVYYRHYSSNAVRCVQSR